MMIAPLLIATIEGARLLWRFKVMHVMLPIWLLGLRLHDQRGMVDLTDRRLVQRVGATQPAPRLHARGLEARARRRRPSQRPTRCCRTCRTASRSTTGPTRGALLLGQRRRLPPAGPVDHPLHRLGPDPGRRRPEGAWSPASLRPMARIRSFSNDDDVLVAKRKPGAWSPAPASGHVGQRASSAGVSVGGCLGRRMSRSADVRVSGCPSAAPSNRQQVLAERRVRHQSLHHLADRHHHPIEHPRRHRAERLSVRGRGTSASTARRRPPRGSAARRSRSRHRRSPREPALVVAAMVTGLVVEAAVQHATSPARTRRATRRAPRGRTPSRISAASSRMCSSTLM